MFGCVDSWLLYKLTGSHITEVNKLVLRRQIQSQPTLAGSEFARIRSLPTRETIYGSGV